MSATNKLGLALTLASLVACSGCFEEKLTLTVHANGSGTLHLARRSGPALSTFQLLSATSGADERARAKDALIDEMACWGGVTAWVNERYEVRGGRVEGEADAYFEDVNQLACEEPGVGEHRFRARSVDENGLELTWVFVPPRSARELTLEHARVLSRALSGLEISGELVMPGRVTSGSGATRMGEQGPAWTIVSAAELEAEIGDFDKRVRSGELSPEDATSRLRALYVARRATVRCDVSETGRSLDGFRHELHEARKAYDEGDLKLEVEKRRHAPTPSETSARESGGKIISR